jgi:uncharacterized protein YkwD
MVYQPESAFPATPAGRVQYRLQGSRVQEAVLCLINAERSARSLDPLKTYKTLGKGRPSPSLARAASSHVAAAVNLRWWGRVEEGKKCVPMRNNPSQCDPHINPQTGSTVSTRANDAGYGKGCKNYATAENTYVGWGSGNVTPRAAFNWWMGSEGHRNNMLSPYFRETYLSVAWGSADPAAKSTVPALTYVQTFGYCN